MSTNGYMILSGTETGKKKKKVPLRVGMIYTVSEDNSVENRPYYYSTYGSGTDRLKYRISVNLHPNVTVTKVQIPDNCIGFRLSGGYIGGTTVYNENCKSTKPLIVPKAIISLEVHNTAQIVNMEHFIDNDDAEIQFRATNAE